MLERAHRPVGRDAELRHLDSLLGAAAQGPAAVLLEGPVGIGKSILAEAAAAEASRRGIRVLTTRPSGAEASWAYQSLDDLLAGVDGDVLEALPGPQREAIDVALLRATPATTVDPSAQARLVSLATLSVLVTLGRDRPVLLVIDDLDWVDAATSAVLAFVLPRLGRAAIRVLATQRVAQPSLDPLGFARAMPTERIWLEPLTMGALHALIADRLGLTLPRLTLARLHAMSGGNPFHALEIGRALQRLPALPRPGEPLPIPNAVGDLTRAHLAAASESTREVLLVAAAAGSPTFELLSETCGPAADGALTEAMDIGLVSLAAGVVRFAHPTLASVLYGDASAAARRRAHARLADVLVEAEPRARHLALATPVPGPEVAAALEVAARDAKSRGAVETSAELSRLAVDRTPADDAAGQQRRRLLLANALMELPDLPAAAAEATDLVGMLPAGKARAEARMLAGTAAWYTTSPRAAVAHLLPALADAAGDPELTGRLHYRLAVFHEFDPAAARRHAETAIRTLGATDARITMAAAMFELFWVTIAMGDPPPLALLDQALAIEGTEQHADKNTVPGLWWIAIDRPDLARARFEDMLAKSRTIGQMSGEPDLLTRLAETELYADRWELARSLADDATVAARQEGQPTADPAIRIRALIDAHLGDLEPARSSASEGLQRAEAVDDRLIAVSFLHVLTLIAVSDGNPAEVERLTARSAAHLEAFGRVQPLRLDPRPERIEALVALQRIDEAEAVLATFAEGARTVPRPWAESAIARGLARIRAAQGQLDEAIAVTDAATDARSIGWRRFDRARTQLVRGELLRGARARRDAESVLGSALATFDDLGAAAWAQRTRDELDRLGRRRSAAGDITPMERRVAELAAAGLRNREVAELLGISPKTVEAHLAQVYGKLGIRSRAELGAAFRESKRPEKPPISIRSPPQLMQAPAAETDASTGRDR